MCCVMVSASSVVDRGFEPRLGRAKDYKIVSCCFAAKSKDWLAPNRDNMFM